MIDRNKYPEKAFFPQHLTAAEVTMSNKHREKFAELARMLHDDLPANAYRCEAVDLLENAAMHATKAFSHKDYDGQE